MKESILNGKSILAVDDEPNVLVILEEEVLTAAPKCKPGWKHIFKKLEEFFKEKFGDLKELIDDMSLYPERRL